MSFLEQERKLLRDLRGEEVLKDIRREHLTEFFHEGTLLIGCGDCHRFWEGIDWLRNHTDGVLKEGSWQVQLCVFNGAPLHLSLFGTEEHKLILRQFTETNQIKGIERAIVYGHGPCGAASLLGFSLPQNLALTMRATEAIMDEFGLERSKIVSLFHVDYNGKDMRLYKIKRGAWKRAAETNIEIRAGIYNLPL